jgi:hypothetical protein
MAKKFKKKRKEKSVEFTLSKKKHFPSNFPAIFSIKPQELYKKTHFIEVSQIFSFLSFKKKCIKQIN